MKHFLFALAFYLGSSPVHAWNAAGHRLVAAIAWQQISVSSQRIVSSHLASHPDYPRWQDKAKSDDGMAILAEASTWPDDIRHDPRFYDEGHGTPTPPFPNLADTARHKRWHYVDLNQQGEVRDGEIDHQIDRLSRLLRSTAVSGEISSALPWLLHLVADIHQPLHVGRHGDEGGNQIEIENPFNRRLPFSSLHTYWDDLPGPPWLRGARLEKNASRLVEKYGPPEQGNVARWRDESHQLLARAYPATAGSLLPIITPEFHQQARESAERRLVDAGYRLGRLLESIFAVRVSRETP